MNYIIMAAGAGKRLNTFTEDSPKCLIDLGCGETVIDRMVRIIRECDGEANINVVVGFRHKKIIERLKGCSFVYNPFYRETNSVASMWFAAEARLLEDQVIIINGDVVLEKEILEKVINHDETPFVLIDGSVKVSGDYKVQIDGNRVIMMSKDIEKYSGEYVGVTKLDSDSALLLRDEVRRFVERGSYSTWYENVLVQMILDFDFNIHYLDIDRCGWAELDTVDDIILARKIQKGK